MKIHPFSVLTAAAVVENLNRYEREGSYEQVVGQFEAAQAAQQTLLPKKTCRSLTDTRAA